MTTSADPAPTPADPAPSDYAEVWRAIGGLEATTSALLEGQRELKEGQQQLKQELRAEFHAGQLENRIEFQTGLWEVNRRVNRIFYAVLAGVGALLVAEFVTRYVGS